ncbi:ECF transporter S component [Virgibacillus xinjiangensis]|uniref:ECF transporter S component n=1 Tax=Virgibacillus xinjiangensis TaxID=393090 RepID=A0ABV7CRA7_9BACI
MNTYRLTLLALLAAMAVVGRAAFAFLPNVQPVTSIIIICGIFLGPLSAVLLSLITVFLSNMLLGMGIWTVWQIVSWALIGLLSGWIGKLHRRMPVAVLVGFAIFCGYLYGFVVSLTTYQITGKFLPYYIAGLPFDTFHALGNGIFILIFYPLTAVFFKKFKKNHLSV